MSCAANGAIHVEEAVMRFRATIVIAAIASLVALLGLVGIAVPSALASRPAKPPSGTFTAQITYTTGGIPHILAHNWVGLGFGYGYAFATDNLCTMANDYVTVEAQRSAYFGPRATYPQRGNGVIVSNLDSDLFFQQIINSGVVEHLMTALTPDEMQLEVGYVAGYNAYLAHVHGPAGVTDPTCRGKPWVKPITLLDSFLRFYQLMLLGGSDDVISGIAEAAPPAAAQTRPAESSRIPSNVPASQAANTAPPSSRPSPVTVNTRMWWRSLSVM